MIELQYLQKVYRAGDPPALDGVSLRIEPGEVVALLGMSGAGKSTLIRCLNGLVRPDEGSVMVLGRPVHTLSGRDLRAHRLEVGMVFQEFNLIDRFTVLQNVLVGRLGRYPFWRAALGIYQARDIALAMDALARVGLAALRDRPARELSGGQRQRVGIARALVQEPRLILGDEPVANLDPSTASGILELLVHLSRSRGITLVLSLHDVQMARAYCTRAIGLAAGRIVYDGPMDRLTAAELRLIYSQGSVGAGVAILNGGQDNKPLREAGTVV